MDAGKESSSTQLLTFSRARRRRDNLCLATSMDLSGKVKSTHGVTPQKSYLRVEEDLNRF